MLLCNKNPLFCYIAEEATQNIFRAGKEPMARTASEGGFTTRSRDKERTLTTADRSLRMHGLLRRIRPHLLNHPRYHLLTRTSKRQVLIEKFAHTLQVLRFIKKYFTQKTEIPFICTAFPRWCLHFRSERSCTRSAASLESRAVGGGIRTDPLQKAT